LADSVSDEIAGAGRASEETAFAPLRLAEFRSLWTASLFSNVGSFFQITAGSWLMWEMTASPSWVGWMAASRNLPLLLVALPAGVLADRNDRTTLLTVTQISMGIVALVMAGVTFAGRMTPAILLTLGLALGIGNAFNAPAWHSLVPDLVPRSMVTTAVALNSVSFNAARAIGPALAGAVVATLGAGFAFGVNAASYIGIIAVLIIVGRDIASRERDRTSLLRAVITGVRFARHTRAFRRLLLLGSLYALGTAVLQAMLPVKTEELGQDAGTYGVLLGMMGAGAAFGGMSLSRIRRRLEADFIPLAVGLTGLAGVLAGLAPTTPLIILPMFLSGVFWIWTLSTVNATIQLMAPDWVRGRAVSMWLLAYAGIVPIGSILSGLVADRIGAGLTMVILSAATVGIGIWARFLGVDDPSTVRVPAFTVTHSHLDAHPAVEGGPVMISNTWSVSIDDNREFLALMERVRELRLRTGGYRWALYRQIGSGSIFDETYLVRSWDEHLAQHRRIDDEAAAILARAARLDRSISGPVARHLVAVDPANGSGARPVDTEDVVHERPIPSDDSAEPMGDRWK
jgi:MFS family permease